MTDKLGQMPKIYIDWDAINLQSFDNSRQMVLTHIDRILNQTDEFMKDKKSAYITDNCFSRSEMYVIAEVMKAARGHQQSTTAEK